MPDTTCRVDGCDQPTTGTSICPNCSNRLRNTLDEIPALWIELRVTMGRQRAATYTGATASSRETPLPVHLPALLAREYLATTVTAWTRETGTLTGKPCLYDDVPTMARWLGDTPNFGALTRSSAASDAVEELTQGAIREARQVIDTPPGRIYTGPCNSLGALQSDGTPRDTTDQADDDEQVHGCGGPLYIKDTNRYDPTVRCTKCGTTYDQQTRRQWVAAQYAGLYVTIAEASLLLGETRKTLLQRIRRNQVKARSVPLPSEDQLAAAYLLDDLIAETPAAATERHLEAKYQPNRYPKMGTPMSGPQQTLSRRVGA